MSTKLASLVRRWARRLGYVFVVVFCLAGILMISAWSNLGSRPTGTRLEQISQSPQFNVDRRQFVNRLPAVEPRLGPILRDWLKGAPHTAPDQPPPVFPDTREVLARPSDDDLRVTWLGHSTLLVELDGVRLLVDPVWGKRASPWSFMGPARFHSPPVALDDLPEIDAVVISHDHYDHLDAPTIRQLANRVPKFLVPLGVGAHLESWGVAPERIVELDWWDEYEVEDVRVVATPARHFSGRFVIDRDATLWAGWAFIGGERRAFYSGDTAMFPGFAEIGRRLGPFDLTMIESGAYNQRWADVHLGPEQALQAHLDVRGRVMMPVHWGTFDLALHSWVEPAERLIVAAHNAGVTLVVPRLGQSVEPSSPPPVERWWPAVAWQTAEEYPVRSSGLGDAPQEVVPQRSAQVAR